MPLNFEYKKNNKYAKNDLMLITLFINVRLSVYFSQFL